MDLKIKNFRGSWAATNIEPSKVELLWLMENLKEINKKLDSYFSSTFKEHCGYCYETEENYNNDSKSTICSYRISTALVTDIPEDDWDSDDRGLQINICEKCYCWNVVDY